MTVVVAVIAATCACTGGGTNPPQAYGTHEGTGFYRQPPQVRLLADNTVSGAIVYQHWIKNGQWYEDRVKAIPDDLPLARLRPGTPLVFKLTGVSVPAWIDLSVFVTIGSDGQPAGEPERLVCVPATERMPCSVELAKAQRTLQITVRPPDAGKFVAINMGWHRSVASMDLSLDPKAPPEVSATWAFALA